MTNPIQVADRLSEAMRRALVGRHIDLGGHTVLQPTFNVPPTSLATMRALTARGIVEFGRFGATMLTPLGLDVRRAILQEREQ